MTRTRPSTPPDWIEWGALAFVLVSTAHAEYTLTVATGVHPYIAPAVPGALDLYVLRALKVRRDVLPAVLTMVAANIASHLVTAGVLHVTWPLISAVAAVPPLILWRVHVLRHTAPHTRPAKDPVPDYVPDDWEAEYTPTPPPSAPAPQAPPVPPSAPAPVPAPAPAPTSAPAPTTTTIALDPRDTEYADALTDYLTECTTHHRTPSVRGCKTHCGIGQDRARRLLTAAGYTT